MSTKIELKCGNMENRMPIGYSQTVFFDWRIISHTTVSKHTQIYDACVNKCTYNMAQLSPNARMPLRLRNAEADN